jgi:exportin-7
VLECLVYISATRRALFDTDETRTVFINCITEGTKDIIATCYGLTDSDCYNTFCRLLARFRAVSPLSDIMERPGYIEWIEVIAHFTHDAFLSTATMATSVHLLSFWAKIVQSMSYYSRTSKGGSVMEKLEDISVDLCRTFIGHYIAAVPNLVEQMLDGKKTLFVCGGN